MDTELFLEHSSPILLNSIRTFALLIGEKVLFIFFVWEMLWLTRGNN